MKTIPHKIEIEFTDEKITPSGGSFFVHQVALRLSLPSLLENALQLKVRAGCKTLGSAFPETDPLFRVKQLPILHPLRLDRKFGDRILYALRPQS